MLQGNSKEHAEILYADDADAIGVIAVGNDHIQSGTKVMIFYTFPSGNPLDSEFCHVLPIVNGSAENEVWIIIERTSVTVL